MDVINVSRKDVNDICKLSLHGGSVTGEGDVIRNVFDEKEAFKLLYRKSGLYFSNKLYTINALYDMRGELDDAFVLPSKLLSVDEQVIGFSMPLIKGVPLTDVLDNSEVDINVKVKYLKKVGNILDKMKDFRENHNGSNFFLNDLHGRNFVVGFDGKLYVVDLDSCRINGNHPFLSKYLSMFSALSGYSTKYQAASLSCGGDIIADENSDLYCYAMLFLEFLAKSRINLVSAEEYFGYLEYLKSIGAPVELIDALTKVYSFDDNVNFAQFLDSLPYFYSDASFGLYLKRTKG